MKKLFIWTNLLQQTVIFLASSNQSPLFCTQQAVHVKVDNNCKYSDFKIQFVLSNMKNMNNSFFKASTTQFFYGITSEATDLRTWKFPQEILIILPQLLDCNGSFHSLVFAVIIHLNVFKQITPQTPLSGYEMSEYEYAYDGE